MNSMKHIKPPIIFSVFIVYIVSTLISFITLNSMSISRNVMKPARLELVFLKTILFLLPIYKGPLGNWPGIKTSI